ncbi:MAG: hypothetical protein KDD32_04140 [Bacteroidetes bacterium]|nr:hypothetical protein [Bacteroidota bacterium]
MAQVKDSVELFEVEIIDFRSTDLAVPDQFLPAELYNSITDVEGYLSNFSHAFVKEYGQGGFATISLDGLQPRHTQVFWNGLPVNSSTIGITDISAYNFNSDLAVGILKSSDAYRFTGSQMGGAVIMENYYRSSSGMKASFTGGSFGQWGVALSGSQTLMSSKLKLKLNVGFDRAENDFKYKDYSQIPIEVKRQSNAGYKKWFVQPGFEWRINESNSWQFNLLYSTIDRHLPASILSPNNNANQQDDIFRLSNHWKFKKNSWQNNLIIGYVFDQFGYEERSGSTINTYSNYNAHKLVINETLRYKVNDHTIKLGANWLNDIATGSDIDKVKQIQGALSSMWNWNLSKLRLDLSSIVRGEFSSTAQFNVAGNIAITQQPLKNIPLKFGVSGHRNIRNPTINDLYFKPSGNKDLQQESAWQLNGEVSYGNVINSNKVDFTFLSKMEAYGIWLKDMIIWVPTNKIYWQPINLTSVHSRGFKLSNTFRIDNETKDFIFYGSQFYNYAVSTNQSNLTSSEVLFPNDLTIGKQLPYVPVHQLKLNNYISFKGIFTSITTQYTSERFITGSNSYYLQKYWMVDLLAGYRYISKDDQHSISLSFGVNNLTGNHYYQEIAHIPMPGRYYQISINYGFEKK